MSIRSSVARTLVIEGVSQCPTRVVSNTDTSPTIVITLNCILFSKFYRCRRVSVVFSVRVYVRAWESMTIAKEEYQSGVSEGRGFYL